MHCITKLYQLSLNPTLIEKGDKIMAREDNLFTGLELDYNDLPDNTQYRFAEMEIGRAINILAQFIPMGNPKVIAGQYIFKQIQENFSYEDEDAFLEVVLTYRLIVGDKEEQATYFRYHNISYKNIREVTGLSPNTVAKYRFVTPVYYTKYNKWDEGMLYRWNKLKKGLNLFDQELYHTKR